MYGRTLTAPSSRRERSRKTPVGKGWVSRELQGLERCLRDSSLEGHHTVTLYSQESPGGLYKLLVRLYYLLPKAIHPPAESSQLATNFQRNSGSIASLTPPPHWFVKQISPIILISEKEVGLERLRATFLDRGGRGRLTLDACPTLCLAPGTSGSAGRPESAAEGCQETRFGVQLHRVPLGQVLCTWHSSGSRNPELTSPDLSRPTTGQPYSAHTRQVHSARPSPFHAPGSASP